MGEKVLISGGSGFIGTHLTHALLEKGFQVHHLSRNPEQNSRKGVKSWRWDPAKGQIEAGALDGTVHLVHLAGAEIAPTRWTEARKRLLIESRAGSAKLLFDAFKASGQFPQTVISASGIGHYGATTTDTIFTEEAEQGNDFISSCTGAWEKAVANFEGSSRVVTFRIGVVLDRKDGALPQMALPVRYAVGGRVGSGKQWFPWIHIDDQVAALVKAIEDTSMRGIYNSVASEHITNRDFVDKLRRKLGIPFMPPPVPAFILKLRFGEVAVVLLEGSRVSNKKLRDAGFQFKYDSVDAALDVIYG